MWNLVNAYAKSEMDVVTVNGSSRIQVIQPPHPLINHWIAVLTNEKTPCAAYQSAMGELGRLLVYEASRDWSPRTSITGEIQTPVVVIPILRAGLGMIHKALAVLPQMVTYHLGIGRDEKTRKPLIYLNKLPEKFPMDTRVLVVDPILATGATIVTAIDMLIARGVGSKQIKIISALCAPPALEKLGKKFTGIEVYTGVINSEIDDNGYINSGIGDCGDRISGITNETSDSTEAFTN